MQKFFENINVSIPWGGTRRFLRRAKTTFDATRKLLHTESRVRCQAMQNPDFLSVFDTFLKAIYNRKNVMSKKRDLA